MAAPQNTTAVRSESKSALKKKKAKSAVTPTPVEAPPAPASEAAPESSNGDEGDAGPLTPHIKELEKTIRNINKKIANANKVESIVKENSGTPLEDLVTARKINKDQMVQYQKVPGLTASRTQIEQTITQYKKFDQDYITSLAAEKAKFEKSITERNAKELEETVAAVKAEAAANLEKDRRDSLLIISQFLRLAAIRRGEEDVEDHLDENKALESTLTLVYEGNGKAVDIMSKLIQGSGDLVVSNLDETLTTTYADLKAVSQAQAVPGSIADPEEDASTETAEYPVQTDPTIANAGLTEINDPTVATLAKDHEEAEIQGIPQNTGIGEGGNAAAEANWDGNNDLSASQEWVEVPRDATETETGITATPAAPANVQSWADDQPDSPTETSTPAPAANPNDGFHEVNRSRGGNRGDGGRGRGNRGRGSYRGNGNNRNRGGPRGGGPGGNSRGRGRPDDSQ